MTAVSEETAIRTLKSQRLHDLQVQIQRLNQTAKCGACVEANPLIGEDIIPIGFGHSSWGSAPDCKSQHGCTAILTTETGRHRSEASEASSMEESGLINLGLLPLGRRHAAALPSHEAENARGAAMTRPVGRAVPALRRGAPRECQKPLQNSAIDAKFLWDAAQQRTPSLTKKGVIIDLASIAESKV